MFRFVEIEQIAIEDHDGPHKFRVVVQHHTGVEETFKSTVQAGRTTIDVHTYVFVPNTSYTVTNRRRSFVNMDSPPIIQVFREGRGAKSKNCWLD